MEPLGLRFVPSDQELVEHLHHHDGRRTLPSSGFINMETDAYSCRPDRLPNVSRNGSYYYTDRIALNRRTLDGGGYWKSKDKQEPIRKDGKVVGYKRKLDFYLGNYRESTPLKWVMMEYTLRLDKDTSGGTRKALCAIRATAGNRGNEIREAVPNPPLPESDEEHIYSQLEDIIGSEDGVWLPPS